MIYQNWITSIKISLLIVRGHPFGTYAKFSEKLIFQTPWYAQVRVRIRGLEKLVFRKIMIRDENSVKITVHRKSADNNIYLNWKYSVTNKWKTGTLRTLIREQNQYQFWAINVFRMIKQHNTKQKCQFVNSYKTCLKNCWKLH